MGAAQLSYTWLLHPERSYCTASKLPPAYGSISVGPGQCLGYEVLLNKLQRFSDLHTLQLGSDRSGPPDILYLQRPLLPLSSLEIHGNLILCNLDLPCQSLPKLHHLSCAVPRVELQHFLSMPQLAHANLKVHFDDYCDGVEVSINAASELRWLKLTVSSLNGAGDIKLQLSVLQPLLSYYVDCGGHHS